MSIPFADDPDPDILRSVIDHVFLPPKLPQAAPTEEAEHKMNMTLCNSLVEAAQLFCQNVPSSQRPLWMQMINMMELARRAARVPFGEADLQNVFSDMAVGGMSLLARNLFRVWLTIFCQMYFPCISAHRTLR
jgi:hypothetical protein